MTYLDTTAIKIKKARINKKMTQNILSGETGVSLKDIKRCENGHYYLLSDENFQTILKTLGINKKDLSYKMIEDTEAPKISKCKARMLGIIGSYSYVPLVLFRFDQRYWIDQSLREGLITISTNNSFACVRLTDKGKEEYFDWVNYYHAGVDQKQSLLGRIWFFPWNFMRWMLKTFFAALDLFDNWFSGGSSWALTETICSVIIIFSVILSIFIKPFNLNIITGTCFIAGFLLLAKGLSILKQQADCG